MPAPTAAPPRPDAEAAPPRPPEAIPVAEPARRRFRQTRAYAAALRVALSYLWFDAVARARGGRWARRRRAALHRRNGRRVREAVLRLRGLFVKAGQLASVLTQLLPEPFRAELEGLQDRVPAGPPDAVRARIREELGADPEDLFARFDDAPVASASLAQVHRATLHDGREVAVKVQHSDIEAIARIDLRAIETILRAVGRWFGVRGLWEQFREIEAVVLAELDFGREAASAEAIGAALGPGVAVPAVVPELSTRRVLTTEYVEAVKAGDRAALDAAGVDRAALAERILDAYGGMIFRDGLYHADPHPGNLLVRVRPEPPGALDGGRPAPAGPVPSGDGLGALPSEPPALAAPPAAGGDGAGPAPLADGLEAGGAEPAVVGHGAGRPLATPTSRFDLVFLDFGAVARLTPEMRAGLAEMIAGVLARDAGRVTAALGLMGFVADGRGGAADAAVLALVEGVHERILRGIDPDAFRLGDLTLEYALETHAETFGDMADLGVSVGDLASAFRVPRDWILLERTALLLIGLCTALDPDANPLRVLRPHIEPLVGDVDVGGAVAARAGGALKSALALPGRLDRVLTQVEDGTLAVRAPDAVRAADRVYAGLRQVAYAVAAAGAGGVAYAARAGGDAGLALGLAGLSGLCAVGAVASAWRERRAARR